MFSIISMSQSPIEFQINDTVAQKNGEARSESSDVVAYLDLEELQVMQADIKKQHKKRVPTIRILNQYEKFFTRHMNNAPTMVRAIKARVLELEALLIDEEYEKDWIYHQSRLPGKMPREASGCMTIIISVNRLLWLPCQILLFNYLPSFGTA